MQSNRTFHRYLMDGVLGEFTNAKGEKEADYAQLVDFTWASLNDFLVVNQFTMTGTKKPRRPDLVCFVNGLPLGLIELKNPVDQQADVSKPFDPLQTYQAEISDLPVFNEALVVSDGMKARVTGLEFRDEDADFDPAVAAEYRYPPEGHEAAIALVLAQAQALADDWSAG